nr:excitatory amino acid transporter 3 [Nothobranchius furzeri]
MTENQGAFSRPRRSWTDLCRKFWGVFLRNKWQILALLSVLADPGPRRVVLQMTPRLAEETEVCWRPSPELPLGVFLGMILRIYAHLTDSEKGYINYPGELLSRMLRMVTTPLIVTSVIIGMSEVSSKSSRRIAARVLVYIFSTTVLAVTTGILLSVHIKPGFSSDVTSMIDVEKEDFFSMVALMDLVRNMIPASLIIAFFAHYKTETVEAEVEAYDPISGLPMNLTEFEQLGRTVPGTNMVGLIVWSCIGGLLIGQIGEANRTLVKLLKDLNMALTVVAHWITWYMPYGLIFMIASHVTEVEGWGSFMKLGKLAGVILLGLIIHGMVILPFIYLVLVRRNPFVVMREVSHVLFTAMRMSSSADTLPETMQCCEERLKFDPRITRFMLPIASNLNMNGSVLYEVASVVFIAQLNDIHLNGTHIVNISLTAAASCMGAEGVPAIGALTSVFILSAVGLPAKGASLLVLLEWILDHFNTVINVWGNCIGVALIHHLSQNELPVQNQSG